VDKLDVGEDARNVQGGGSSGRGVGFYTFLPQHFRTSPSWFSCEGLRAARKVMTDPSVANRLDLESIGHSRQTQLLNNLAA
jgi:hypothetical protein